MICSITFHQFIVCFFFVFFKYEYYYGDKWMIPVFRQSDMYFLWVTDRRLILNFKLVRPCGHVSGNGKKPGGYTRGVFPPVSDPMKQHCLVVKYFLYTSRIYQAQVYST